MVEYGFSLKDIRSLDKYDIREVRQLKLQMDKKKKINRLISKLDLSDSIIHSVIATHSKRGYKIYEKWHNKVIYQINNLLNKKDKKQTIWEKMKRKSNRI